MAVKVYTLDDVTSVCSFRSLVPYTAVTSDDGSITVSLGAGANGQPVYDISGDVAISIDTMSFDSGTKLLTITESDGGSNNVDLTDLVDIETITTITPDGFGGYNYTNENGTVYNIAVAPPETITTLVADGSGGFNYTNENGIITNIPPSEVTAVVSGNVIANHDNGAGTVVDIEESITTLVSDGSGGLDYTNEVGTVTNIPFGDVSWSAPTLLNSWANFGAPYEATGYRKIGDAVYLRIYLKDGASDTAIMFTLPVAYRPANTRLFVLSTATAGTPVSMKVDGSGNVSAVHGAEVAGTWGDAVILL